MQLAVVEIARNLLNIKDADSSEFSKTNNPVIGLMTEWMKDNIVEKRKNSTPLREKLNDNVEINYGTYAKIRGILDR